MTRWETATESKHRLMRWLLVMGVILTTGLIPANAEASTAEERAMADALFREAKALMRKKDYPKACRKFEESQRLDPRDGTLLNLAVCHEKEGKFATAWVEFQESLAAAKAAKRWGRITLAKRRMKALESKVPFLTVEVSPGAATGFELRRNGVVIAQPAWGTAMPVDPGEHKLEASAPGHIPWDGTFEVDVGQDKTVVVPVLTEKPKPPPPKPKPKPKPPEMSNRELSAYVVGGAGIVATGVGAYFGLKAMGKSGDSDEHCNGSLCDQTGLDLNDEAKSAARVSNIAFGLGLIGVGVGSYLLLTEPEPGDHESKDAAQLLMTPVALPGQAAIVVRGRW